MEVTGDEIRRIVLDQSMRAGVGHIGSALSIADILAVLYGQVLRIDQPEDPERDRFILSKGHAALALYAALHLRGWIDEETLDTYCADDSVLGVHPEHALRGVDFSTGSLGHGLAYGAGAALAARMAGSDRRAFVLISDAELNEGSVWEAVMFSAHHRLANLVAILDANGLQALGKTAEVLDLGDLASRFAGCGWEVREVDGHEPDALADALGETGGSGAPLMVIARTVLGKGVSFMEHQVKWHYWSMSDEEYDRAKVDIASR